jgi:hypothetical protein
VTGVQTCALPILLESRQKYLRIRERALALVNSQKPREAMALYTRELLPAFTQYKDIADRLFEYNLLQGKARGEAIMRVCTVTQWVVASIAVFVFVVGFLIGMFK